MRTTITLDPDVERLVKEAMHRRRVSFKQVINDALRVGLSPVTGAREPRAPYRVKPHKARLLPGIDRRGFNKLVDELEDQALIAKSSKRRRES